MMLSGFISPTWDDSYQRLPYIKEVIKQQDVQQQWIDAGHNCENLVIETYSQPNTMPDWVVPLQQHWPDYKDFGYSFHKFVPGHYLPDHRDAYSKYVEKFNIDNTQVLRILLYLEDWKAGQFNTIDTQVISGWTAGTWIGWSGDTLHSVVNFGVTTRYALAITCHK